MTIITNENSIYLAKENGKGLVTVMARKTTFGDYLIEVAGPGFYEVLRSAKILASRMIASFIGVDATEVEKALQGVA